MLEPLPDLGSLSDEGLKSLIDELQVREREVSYERRILHGKIDILRAELVSRLQESGGKSILDQVDLSQADRHPRRQGDAGVMTRARRLRARRVPYVGGEVAMSHVYCTECGFQNPETANYCSRCGALLEKGDVGRRGHADVCARGGRRCAARAGRGPRGPGARRSLRRRPGGGELPARGAANAHRPLAGVRDLPRRRDRLTQPRRPASSATGRFFVEDEGSLNGTFVNRKRIDQVALENGDELQIGKYRLTFIER